MVSQRDPAITPADEGVGIKRVNLDRPVVLHDRLLVLSQAVVRLTQPALGRGLPLDDLP